MDENCNNQFTTQERMNEDNGRLESHYRVLQLIAAALIAGVVIFASLSILIVDQQKFGFHGSPLAIVCLAVLPLALIASFVVPRVFVRNAAQAFSERNPKADAQAVHKAGISSITSATIVGCALREAAALLGLVVWILESNALGLSVAGVAIASMVLAFPRGFQLEQRFNDFQSVAARR